MTLLKRFKVVAELEHMSQAAELLNLAQPALSRNISQLEKELDVDLFDRSGRTIELNKFGRIFLKYTDSILSSYQDAIDQLNVEKGSVRKVVHILLNAASKMLPELIMNFNQEYPSILLNIRQEKLNLLDNESDITIYSSKHARTERNDFSVLEEEILLALPYDHILAKRDEIDLRDASDLNFIGLPKGKNLRKITDSYCQEVGFLPNVILECDSPELTREFINAGLGAAFVPAVSWRGVQSDKVVLKKIKTPVCKRYINLFYQKDKYLSPAALLFRDYCKNFFGEFMNK